MLSEAPLVQIVMLNFNLFALSLACGAGESILKQLKNAASPPGRLVALAIGVIVSALMMLVPPAQRGSTLALITSYLLVGLLIFSILVLFGFSRLPGKASLSHFPAIDRIGKILLPILGMGLSLVVKTILKITVSLFVVAFKLFFGLILLWIAALTCSGKSRSSAPLCLAAAA